MVRLTEGFIQHGHHLNVDPVLKELYWVLQQAGVHMLGVCEGILDAMTALIFFAATSMTQLHGATFTLCLRTDCPY